MRRCSRAKALACTRPTPAATAAVEMSAALLRPPASTSTSAQHDLDRIARATLVVASPGVPPDAPPLARRARAAGLPIIGEIEVALHYIPALRYIADHRHERKDDRHRAHRRTCCAGSASTRSAAGNIGMPLSEVALRERRPDWVALEVSSFQLHDTPGIDPAVGVLTNLSADHLDRYASVDEYYADKAMLFRNAHDRSRWVLNGDDEAVMRLAERRPATPPRGARRAHVACGATASRERPRDRRFAATCIRSRSTTRTPRRGTIASVGSSSCSGSRSHPAPICRSSATTTSRTRCPRCSP